MTPEQMQSWADEINNDPIGRGYANMEDSLVSESAKIADRTIPSILGGHCPTEKSK